MMRNLVRRGQAALYHSDGTLMAVMDTSDVYPHDKETEVKAVFGTDDSAHPGVKAVLDEGTWLVGGAIHVITTPPTSDVAERFDDYRLTPTQTRAEFQKRGWKSIVAFQTRNPIHRAHEYLTKCAQEICDGLLIHPLVGETKPGDIPAEVRTRAIAVLIEKYFRPGTVVQAGYPLDMRYAGPREALLHALFRQNYGCAYQILGRDHAGVGNYYGPFDAHRIFDEERIVFLHGLADT